jgi:hypothetical protein
MNTLELATELDNLFGNPLGPKRYTLVREAVDVLRTLDAKIKELETLKDVRTKTTS